MVMPKVELYDILLGMLTNEWMSVKEVEKRMSQIRPGVRRSSVARVLLCAFDNQQALREKKGKAREMVYWYKINPNPPKVAPPKPVRAHGRPKEKTKDESEQPFTCKMPRGAVQVTHNAIDWKPVNKPMLPIRYCKMKDGRYYRIHRNGCGYTPVTKAHIDHMAKERVYR